MNWSKCRQSAGVDARSERLQVVHCVRGEHSTSCFSDSLRLQSASMIGVKQARATRCAAEPSLRDGMSVQEASRCRQEQSWCRAGERGDRRIFQGWQPTTVTRDVRGRQKRERDSVQIRSTNPVAQWCPQFKRTRCERISGVLCRFFPIFPSRIS